MFKLGGFVSIVLLAAATSFAASAADIQGVVSTGVRHGIDKPALVRLMAGQNAAQEQLTDLSGRFRFRKVTPGSYVIRVECDGYYHKDVPIVMSDSTYHVSVTLEASPVETGFSGSFDPFAGLDKPPRAQKEFESGLREEKKTGRCETAMPHLQKAVDLYPKYSEAFEEIGNCYKKMENLPAAEESYKKAMAFSQTTNPAIKLASLYSSQKRFDEAQNVLIKLLPQNPTDGNLYASLAAIYFAIGRIHEAELAALEAQARSHDSGDVHLLLAKIYEGQHKRAAQITQLRAYLDESPSGATADDVRKQLQDLSGNPS